MASLKGKHNIAEIEGTRCTVVENGCTEARAHFLKGLLEFNRYDVRIDAEKAKDGTPTGTFLVGVTDILFNPVIVLYQKRLFRPDGQVVTPAFWNQWGNQELKPYWQVSR